MSITTTSTMTPLVAKGEAAAKKAARAVFVELFGRYQDAMGMMAWKWIGETKRYGQSNKRPRTIKEIARSPRNIVDSGRLRSSGTYKFVGDYTCLYQWTEPYARLMHDGGVTWNGGIIQARPWTSAVNGTDSAGSSIKPYPMTERLESVFLRYFLAS